MIRNEIEKKLELRFKISRSRDLLIPGRRFCRLDLRPVVEAAKKQLAEIGDEAEDFSSLPSWPKVNHFPKKCKPFLATFFKALSQGVNRLESLQIDWQLQQADMALRHQYVCPLSGNSILVEMMFFNTKKNTQLKDIGEIYKEVNPNTHLIVLFGERVNGTSFTNENAQKKVIKDIKKAAKAGKNVMILASRLGQRSFSIPSLSTVYLCYDNGSEAATRQKLARALTADTETKVGIIISCSFDPKSDDKLLPEQIATAQNLRKKNGGSFADNLKYVHRTDNIFDMSDEGLVINDTDDWYNYAYDSGMINRVLGAMCNPYNADSELRNLLLSATGWKPANSLVEGADTGDTFKDSKPSKERNKETSAEDQEARDEAEIISKIRSVLTLVVELFPRMQIGTGKRQVSEILEDVKNNPNHSEWFYKRTNMPIEAILMAVKQHVIDESVLEASLK